MLETAGAIDFSTTWVPLVSDDIARYDDDAAAPRPTVAPPFAATSKEHEAEPVSRGPGTPGIEAGDVVLTTYWVAG